MKIFLLITVLIIIIYIGYMLKRFYEKREKLLSDCELFCNILLTNINFIQMPLSEIIETNKENFSKEFIEILNKYLINLEGDRENFYVQSAYLKRSDSEKINNLLNNLGKTDILNQNSLIESSKILINEACLDAKKESRMYAGTTLKLAICLGCFIVILLI